MNALKIFAEELEKKLKEQNISFEKGIPTVPTNQIRYEIYPTLYDKVVFKIVDAYTKEEVCYTLSNKDFGNIFGSIEAK